MSQQQENKGVQAARGGGKRGEGHSLLKGTGGGRKRGFDQRGKVSQKEKDKKKKKTIPEDRASMCPENEKKCKEEHYWGLVSEKRERGGWAAK